MSDLSDNELFARIATSRDRDAFAELCRRYQSDLLRLARYMTGSQQGAEDAVQEALLRVWRSPEKFKGGHVRHWMLGIAAHESLHLLRAEKAKRRREMEVGSSKPESTDARTAKEQAELHEALRQTLTGLPEAERQMLGLYFGARFTQEEIGKLMGLSQRTISERIEQVLEKLRVRLAQAGFAVSVAAISSADFLNVVEPAPATSAFLSKVIARLDMAPSAAHAATSVAVSKAPWLVVAGCTLAGIATAGWSLSSKRQPAKPAVAPAASPEAAALSPVVPAQRPPASAINRLWDFKAGPADDLQLVEGDWAWQKTHEGGRMLLPPLDAAGEIDLAAVLLPQRFPPGVPFEIILKATLAPKSDKNGVLGHWAAADGPVPARFLFVQRESEAGQTDYEVRIAVTGRRSVSYVGNTLLCALEFDKNWPGDRLVLVLSGWEIQSMEVREVPLAMRTGFEAGVLEDFQRFQSAPGVNSKLREGYKLDRSMLR